MRKPSNVLLQLVRIGIVAIVLLAITLGTVKGTAAQSTTTVTIANFAFSPANLTVEVGDTVVFVNSDSVAHTATATDGSFDTGTIQPGGSASVTFSSAGTLAYICAIHPTMTGSVTVDAPDNGNDDGGTTELPDTGAGPLQGNSDSNIIAGLLALASIALAVVSRIVRPAKSTSGL